MKKIFTLLTLLCTAMVGMATDYTCELTVTVNGESTDPQETTVSVEEDESGTYTLTLINFWLGSDTPVGTIVVEGVEGTTEDDVLTLTTEQTIQIQDGEDDEVSTWIGPLLGDVPIVLEITIEDGNLSGSLDIDMQESLGQTIEVVLSSISDEEESDATSSSDAVYQIPNSDFESFHTATYDDSSSDEPDNWHSFMSATGTWTIMVSTTAQTFSSDDVRPGSDGSSSVLIVSRSVSGIASANGTITTGRLQAGSITATSTDNCSFLDMSLDDVDDNGDPFYAELDGTPDSLAVWVKHHVGTRSDSNADYVYATISAIITDGTYYQDPEDEDETYTNVVAKAVNAEIAAVQDEDGNDEWQRVVIPFDYDSYSDNGAETKAILVTISTCAYPGGGSMDSDDPDSLHVDDFSLIYNAQLASLSVDGTEVDGFDKDTYSYSVSADASTVSIEAEADGKGATVTTDIDATNNVATITVVSNDGETSNVYTIDLSGATGISSIADTTEKSVKAYYNLNGQQITTPAYGQIYIVKYTDGTTVKRVNK